ncbi:unnamed protein product, partial [Polarella glacialis]
VVEAAASLPLPPGARLLDAGTGSGCILLGLLQRLPGAIGLGIDQDPAAVQAASANAATCGFAERGQVQLLQFQQLGQLPSMGFGPLDLAVSNPPYLAEKVCDHVGFARDLQTQSRKAFASGEDGNDAYEELAASLAEPGVLAPGAWVVMGCQPGHTGRAAKPFLASGRYERAHEEFERCADAVGILSWSYPCGALACAFALKLAARQPRVIATDLPEVVPLMVQNAGANKALVECASLPWGDLAAAKALAVAAPAVVVACEVAYWGGWDLFADDTRVPLADTLAALLIGEDTGVRIGLLVFTIRDESRELALLPMLRERGLEVVQVSPLPVEGE